MSTLRFSHFAERNPGALALVDPQEREWSRGELAALANRLARALRQGGLAPGDVLAIAAPNCFEYVATYLAAMQIGLYAVPVNWHLKPAEVQYILEDCKAVALVTHERTSAAIVEALQGLSSPPRVRVSVGAVEGFTPMEDFIAGRSPAPLEDPVIGRVLSYTSATTGRPKGVVLPLSEATRVLDLTLQRRVELGTVPESHVQMCVSMLYHGAPLETVYISLHMGHAVVLTEGVSPESVLRLIEKYRVTLVYMVPTMMTNLLRLSEAARSRYSLATLTRIVHGGGPCPIETKRRMIEWLGPILGEVYASTEGGGTVIDAKEWLKYPGTVGRPIAGTRLRILNEEGEELPPGEVGTIYMSRYTGDRFEYLGDAVKTQASYRGELFTVGDVGYVNEEGYLFICDRKIDMIIRSGVKVYPAEVEGVLAAHPAVADAAVFGVPDSLTGESVMAVIQPVVGTTPNAALRGDLLTHVARHLSLAKVPRYIVFATKLPREETGKLQKRRLREQYWEQRQLAGNAPGTTA